MRRVGGAVVGLTSLACVGAMVGQPRETSISSYATSLVGRTQSQGHNAKLSLGRLNGVVLEPGEVFSFNALVGSFSRDQGYRKAPVSYNGQLIDSWGGGVCQTSTTLYNAALLAGMHILERHRHRFAPSYVAPGRDAAVAFNSIDLKFRNPHPFSIRIAAVEGNRRLEVRFLASQPLEMAPEVYTEVHQVQEPVSYRIGDGEGFGRIRNTGKRGWQVAVYRETIRGRELISSDNYPAMNRIVETR